MLSSYCILFLTIIIAISSGVTEAKKFQGSTIITEIPRKEDLSDYLASVERVTNFFDGHKDLIDINVYFGVFMTNVNFLNIIQLKRKTLPLYLLQQIRSIINKNEKLLAAYWHANQDDLRGMTLSISLLISNTSTWASRLLKYPGALTKQLQQQNEKDTQQRFPEWNIFLEKTDEDAEHHLPLPEQSDMCLDSISINNPNNENFDSLSKCKTLPECYHFLIHGSDMGYGLSHRMLLLLMARLGRGCTFFTSTMDRELSHRFCMAAFWDAKNIANHGFIAIDLLMEHIFFCIMNGHTEFLSRSWVSMSLRFQTPIGCFYQTKEEAQRNSYSIHVLRDLVNRSQILNGQCDSHVTGVATAMLSAATRSLILIYY